MGVMRNNGAGGFQGLALAGMNGAVEEDLTGIVGWSVEAGQCRVLVGQANDERGVVENGGVREYELFYLFFIKNSCKATATQTIK